MEQYWWSCYGDFEPGEGIYPHMGQVIAHYRLRRGLRTQNDLAIALGYSKRSIEELEGSMNLNTPDSVERRMLLAKLLRIPPALLALDWRFMVYPNNNSQQENNFTDMLSLLQEDTFALYEDILIMGRNSLDNGGPLETAYRIDKRLKKLVTIVQNSSEIDREQWQSLLCRFFQLSTSFALRNMDKKRALSDAGYAIEIAKELDDAELLASTFYRRSRVHMEHRVTATDEAQKYKYLELAKADVLAALSYTERVRTPLKGSIYLIAAEVEAFYAINDISLRKQCEKWQEKAANLIYRGKTEDDGTFLKLDTTALHHEKAKSLLSFNRLQEARNELTTAWKTVTPGLLTWHINMHLTEANIYKAEHDLEGSARSGIEAYKLAKAMQAHKRVAEVEKLFFELQQLGDTNPYVCNLGMLLGLY
jgi:transcriptional regulator with XRE-family HTH domain